MTTATELRKSLFRSLDTVAEGREVDFVHKGVAMRIVAQNRSSRLARLAAPSPDEPLSERDTGWDAAAQSEWERDLESLP